MKKITLVIAIIFGIISCESNNNETSDDDKFNRKALLINWADNIIVPSYKGFQKSITTLKQSADSFTQNPNNTTLQQLRVSWESAYLLWQHVAMFKIGPAEEIDFVKFMNIYPTNTKNITDYINSGNYDFTRVSFYDEQGFPALDYLLNGLGNSDTEILAFYTSNTNASKYKKYLTDLINRMNNLTTTVVSKWTNEYRDTFISRNGMSASSSLNQVTNDYVSFYEKNFRTGKIGIPAGLFSENAFPEKVEGYFKKDISKPLFSEALKAIQNFFNGQYFSSTQTGESLKSYLDYLNSNKNNSKLSDVINAQFNATKKKAESVNNNFYEQIKNNNSAMKEVYNELQANLILLKVNMLQAINVNVDYTDSDGD